MLKPVTFSISLAVALGACSLGLAGHGHTSLPSAQSAPSPQGVVASPQGYDGGCDVGPVGKKSCLGDLFKHKAPQYEYEWVLKKKRVWTFKTPSLFSGHKGLGLGHKGGACGGAAGGCDACGGGIVTPSAQYATPQGGAIYGSGQAATYGTGQIGGASQIAAPIGGTISGPADAAPAPPISANPSTASNGSLLFLAPAGN